MNLARRLSNPVSPSACAPCALARNPSRATAEADWNRLQAEYNAAYEVKDDYDRALSSKYGRQNVYFASAGEKKKLAQLRARQDRIYDRLLKLLDKYATRDWRSGVPAHWVAGKLTWADAVRPPGEMLDEVPPVAYGY